MTALFVDIAEVVNVMDNLEAFKNIVEKYKGRLNDCIVWSILLDCFEI